MKTRHEELAEIQLKCRGLIGLTENDDAGHLLAVALTLIAQLAKIIDQAMPQT